MEDLVNETAFTIVIIIRSTTDSRVNFELKTAPKAFIPVVYYSEGGKRQR